MASTHAVPLAAPLSPGAPKRALVLPGGGLRLSYQAGILLALQEAGLAFQYIDGTSGGSLNMSMLLSGLEPAEICERWRSLNLRDTISFLPLKEYLKVENLEGLGDADGFRTKVLPHFGIDFGRIRAVDSIAAGYNVLDYGNKAVKAIPHRDIDEDMVIAGMSLPGVFPPVRKDGGIYLDTGFVQDANLLETVKNGAEDIWVLWGLGNTGVYRGGPLHLYVQMLEMSADTALNHQLEAIRELNGRIERGESPYGQTRPIRVHVIKPEYPLPLDPDLYLGKIDHATLIDMGYADGKRYLQTCATAPAEIPPNPSRMQDPAPASACASISRANSRGRIPPPGSPRGWSFASTSTTWSGSSPPRSPPPVSPGI
jgi:predicted acylesterase/phospholipase RssA